MCLILEDVAFTALLIDNVPAVKYGDNPEPCFIERMGLDMDVLYLSPLVFRKS